MGICVEQPGNNKASCSLSSALSKQLTGLLVYTCRCMLYITFCVSAVSLLSAQKQALSLNVYSLALLVDWIVMYLDSVEYCWLNLL